MSSAPIRRSLRVPSVEPAAVSPAIRRALAGHADETLALAAGRVLALLPGLDGEAIWGPMVTSVRSARSDGALPVGPFDTVACVGALGTAVQLETLLADLADRLTADGRLLFCEPTESPMRRRSTEPNDVTGTLWAQGWSVLECRRFRRGGRRGQEFCWGSARRTRWFGPRRSGPDR